MTRAVILLLTVIGLLGLAAPGVAGSPGPFETLGLLSFESGIKAPDFSLPGLNGNSVRLSSPSGSATLLVFWATW